MNPVDRNLRKRNSCSDINVWFGSFVLHKKNIREILSKIVRSVNIIQDANMIFIHNLVIHLYFRKVCYTWMLDCVNACPWRSKNEVILTDSEKEVKSILLKNSFYTLEEFFQANLCRDTVGSGLYLGLVWVFHIPIILISWRFRFDMLEVKKIIRRGYMYSVAQKERMFFK
jgi:hypothetical protein